LIFEYYEDNILVHFISYLLITLVSGLFMKFNCCTYICAYTKPLIYGKANEKLLRAAGCRKLRNLLRSCYNLSNVPIVNWIQFKILKSFIYSIENGLPECRGVGNTPHGDTLTYFTVSFFHQIQKRVMQEKHSYIFLKLCRFIDIF